MATIMNIKNRVNLVLETDANAIKQVNVDEVCNAVDFFVKNSSITWQVLAFDSGQSLNWQTPDILKGKEWKKIILRL